MIVEDGTGVAGANAYISVSYATAYHAERGNAWAGTTTEMEQAIVRASDYLDQMPWGGTRLTTTQGLQWPRVTWGYPDAIKRACAEYALRARSAALESDEEDGAAVKSLSTQVGPLQKQVVYSVSSRKASRRSYPAADRLIERYLIRSTGEVYV